MPRGYLEELLFLPRRLFSSISPRLQLIELFCLCHYIFVLISTHQVVLLNFTLSYVSRMLQSENGYHDHYIIERDESVTSDWLGELEGYSANGY